MNTTTHTITVCIAQGDPDLGAEIELAITFKFTKGAPERGPAYDHGGLPADPDEVEFVSCKNVHGPAPYGAFADLEQDHMNDIATMWLEDKGFDEAVAYAVADIEAGREAADEARAELRKEDR